MKKAIAMKCNKKQFKNIEPKLLKAGFLIENVDKFKTFLYLVNNYTGHNLISNASPNQHKLKEKYEIHETWNEKVFLEACGIETDPEYLITKSQLIELKNGYKTEKLLEWFPEAFKEDKLELVVRKWYKANMSLFCYKKSDKSYGFTSGKWSKPEIWIVEKENVNEPNWNPVEATSEEVTEALTKEAVKRKLVKGCYYINADHGAEEYSHTGEYDSIHLDDNIFYLDGNTIFKDGKWAKILETI